MTSFQDLEEVLDFKLLLIEVDRCENIDGYRLTWIERVLLILLCQVQN